MLMAEAWFTKMLALERKRTERSGIPFLLVLLNIEHLSLANGDRDAEGRQIVNAFTSVVRETDLVGWYKSGMVMGIVFPEARRSTDTGSIVNPILAKVMTALNTHLPPAKASRIAISWHMFPETPGDDSGISSNKELYPDLANRNKANRFLRIIKRAIDVIGSVVAMVLFSWLFLLIGAAIKLTSKGPIFFLQRRVGQYGVSFWFLKFRSMYVNNDGSAHREYMQRLIAGIAEKHPCDEDDEGVYKLTADPRITPVGRFLRRTSLDELPQFLNVLKGDMSLVGPRPPIDYEVERYDLWHRRRLLEAKPGITGLWQVNGRNRIAFDEMVRLDLRYAKTWSPWLDLKIMLRTPKAMVNGGAH